MQFCDRLSQNFWNRLFQNSYSNVISAAVTQVSSITHKRKKNKRMVTSKRVLVTGATGQIGYMTYKRLQEQPEKYDAYALDYKLEPSVRVPGSWTLEIPDEKFILCDIADFDQVRRAVEGMDVVAHLAADPSGESWESLLNSNIIGTYNVFEACKVTGVARIVAASSIMVSQGHHEQEPYKAMMERRHADIPDNVEMITPNTPAEPRGLYAATKVWTESLARTSPIVWVVVSLRSYRSSRARSSSSATGCRHLCEPTRYCPDIRAVHQC